MSRRSGRTSVEQDAINAADRAYAACVDCYSPGRPPTPWATIRSAEAWCALARAWAHVTCRVRPLPTKSRAAEYALTCERAVLYILRHGIPVPLEAAPVDVTLSEPDI